MSKTYTADEALVVTGVFIDEQAEILRQNLRNKRKTYVTEKEYA